MQEAEIEPIRKILARAADTGHHLNAIGAVLARNTGAVLARKGSGLRGRRVAAALVHRVAQVRDLQARERGDVKLTILQGS